MQGCLSLCLQEKDGSGEQQTYLDLDKNYNMGAGSQLGDVIWDPRSKECDPLNTFLLKPTGLITATVTDCRHVD